VVGIALALAGADVVLTDLPHITPLTQQNVDANCRHTVHRAQVCSRLASRISSLTAVGIMHELWSHSVSCCKMLQEEVCAEGNTTVFSRKSECWVFATDWASRVQVLDLEWGSDAAALGRQPDLVTGADVVYEEHCFPALLASIEALSAAHTVTMLAFRLRGASARVLRP